MVTGLSYILRHGPTAPSVRYIASGRASLATELSAEGRELCRALNRSATWLTSVESCTTSGFARTQETASLLLGERHVPTDVERRLDEVDYGCFDGGPWMEYGRWLEEAGPGAVPNGADESWARCGARMLEGLSSLLSTPATRLIVGHGLMIALLRRFSQPEELSSTRLPEAGYLKPLVLTDDVLAGLIERGRRELMAVTVQVPGDWRRSVHD